MWVSYGALILTLKEEQSHRAATIIQRQSRSDFSGAQITFFRSINLQKPSLFSPVPLWVRMTLFAISKLKLLERCSWELFRSGRHSQINLYSLHCIPRDPRCIWTLEMYFRMTFICIYLKGIKRSNTFFITLRLFVVVRC